jgi:hypothetical protein
LSAVLEVGHNAVVEVLNSLGIYLPGYSKTIRKLGLSNLGS